MGSKDQVLASRARVEAAADLPHTSRVHVEDRALRHLQPRELWGLRLASGRREAEQHVDERLPKSR